MDSQGTSNLQRNRILNAMSNADLALLQPHMERKELKFRQRASVVAVCGGERRQAEIAIVGREGMTGLPVVYGVGQSPHDVFFRAPVSHFIIFVGSLRNHHPVFDSAMRYLLDTASLIIVVMCLNTIKTSLPSADLILPSAFV